MLTVATISFSEVPSPEDEKVFLAENAEGAALKAIAFMRDVYNPTATARFPEAAYDILVRDRIVSFAEMNAVVRLSALTNSHEFNRSADAVSDDIVVDEGPVYLYILMRNDLASLNSGKAVAQGTHAANQMTYEARQKDNTSLNALLHEWEQETGKGFGTCICLSVDNAEMHQLIDRAILEGLHAAITHDPSYPLRDGRTTHLIPLDTCAYVFARKVDCDLLSNLSLMA